MGVIGLAGPLLGPVAEQGSEPAPARLGRHRVRCRGRPRGGLFPDRKPAPDRERFAAAGRGFRSGKGGEHRSRPGPPGLGEHRRERRRVGAGRRRFHASEPVEQRVGDPRQQRRLAFLVRRDGQFEREREAARRRCGAAGRADEGEQLQQIERREAGDAEPPRRRRKMHDQRRWQCRQEAPRVLRREGQELAVAGEKRRPRMTGDEGGGRRGGHRRTMAATPPCVHRHRVAPGRRKGLHCDDE